MPEGNPLEPGLYETPITRRIDDALAVLGDLAKTAPLEPADAHVVLTRHLAKHIAAALQTAPDLEAKLVLANAILGSVRELTRASKTLPVRRSRIPDESCKRFSFAPVFKRRGRQHVPGPPFPKTL